MSAFLCSPAHIGRLVAFYTAKNRGSSRVENPSELATILAKANLRSVGVRYEMSDDQTADDRGFAHADDYVAACVADALRPLPQLTPVVILKQIACLSYQCCEVDDWQQTEAYNLLEGIEAAAHRALPGYDEAVWGYERPEGLRVMK